MHTDLVPTVEATLPADSWVLSPDVLTRYYQTPGRITQDELERREAEYLARGGVIQRIPIGATAEVTTFNNHSQTNNARHYASDAEMTAKIAELLPTVKQKRDLPETLGCSDDKVQRLLRTYFAADPQAKPFMRNCRDLADA